MEEFLKSVQRSRPCRNFLKKNVQQKIIRRRDGPPPALSQVKFTHMNVHVNEFLRFHGSQVETEVQDNTKNVEIRVAADFVNGVNFDNNLVDLVYYVLKYKCIAFDLPKLLRVRIFAVGVNGFFA